MTERRIDRDYYDAGEYFDAGTEHLTDLASPFQRYRLQKVLELHRPGPEDRVLDLGCGWGTFSLSLAPLVREVVGVDFSERSVELCERRARAMGLDNVSFICRDAGDTGLEDASFDVVIAADLLEHLYPEDSERVMAEASRVLKPGGRLVLWTPHRGHFLEILKNRRILLKPDPTHVDYKSMARVMEGATGQGMVIEKAYYTESHLPVLAGVERLLLKWIPVFRRRIAVLARKAPPGSLPSSPVPDPLGE